jgi:RHS repeat-associated protein
MPGAAACQILRRMKRNGILAALVAALLITFASPAVAAPARDIKIPSVTATLDGATVHVAAKLKTRGKVKSFAVAYRLGDVALGQKKLRGGKRRQRVAFALPAGLAPGQYALTACADPRKRVRERNERNNCRTAKTPIVITRRPVPSGPKPPGPKPPVKDRTAPNTTITAGPPAFEFTSDEAGSSFQCRLDGGTFAACTSPRQIGALPPGTHDFEVRAIDRAGNVDTTPATHSWNIAGDGGPGGGPKDPPAENPAEEAPQLPNNGTTTVADATSFLYTGANPIQKDVAAGAIKENRVAVLRGRVLNRMGGGIAGVRVTVLDHPELGRTSTRTDGRFDIAVNGGGAVTLRYERAGWIPVQRTVETPWEDYASVEDAVMIPYDDAVTTIDLDSEEDIQVHRATASTDADGTRRATLMFAEGTNAEMVLPDGSKQPLEDLDVRATEYTVGPDGREAMPGALPTASGYTYAVELSVDEAVEAGATEVRFDKPVVTYVDNFLEFPVGGAVPIGYYDRLEGRWEASENGRVIKIVGESGGRADVDIDGDGTADDGAALGITDAERQRLADLYDPGKSLWRVSITHFTPWDCNWPYAPPEDSVPPPVPVPNQNRPKPKKECLGLGSIIGCQSQRLGQAVRVVGTSYGLRYWSDRTPGYKENNTLNTPLVPAKVPSGLQQVIVQIDIAGQHFEGTYQPKANLEHDFVWDGKDAYGREVVGSTPATVRIGYRYGVVHYNNPAAIDFAFGRLVGPGGSIEGARERMDVVIWNEHRDEVETALGGFDARAQGLGGWTADVNHIYDERTHTVQLGGGGQLNADPVITTAAGNGNAPMIPRQGDGQEGPNVPLGEPYEAEVGPDGTVYFAEITEKQDGSTVGAVRKLDPDGHVRTLATNLGGAIGLGVADDGTVYVAESTQRRVRRIAPNGTVFPFAGGGTATGEGIPAATAKLNYPSDVAIAPDGGIYVSEYVLGPIGTVDHGIVRHIGPDGLITTVAGGGAPDDGVGDGLIATEARLASATGIAIDQNGQLVIAETERIRRVDAGGRISTIAGGGEPQEGNGDGGPATEARVSAAFAVDVASDGAVLFLDNARIRRIKADGTIMTLAGGGSCGTGMKCAIGDKGPAPRAALPGANGIAAAPDGSFYVTTSGDEINSGRLRKVARPLVRQHGGRGVVPSSDGTEAYEFDETGRHLRTLDGLTGAVLLTFGYDGAGRLASIKDADGNETKVERAGDGTPLAIVAPGGQRTTLHVGANGWLDRVENPAGEATRFEYKPDGLGLMTKLIDPRDEVHEFGYTAAGRLSSDKDPDLGTQLLDVDKFKEGYRVTRISALGRTRTYTVQRHGDGSMQMETTTATGAKTVVLTRHDGTQRVTYPDGTKVELQREPDPQWGFNAPMLSSYKITTPDGKSEEAKLTRAVTLADPLDPLSVATLTDKVQAAGKTTTTVYDAEAHTLTTTSPKGRKSTTTLDEHARVSRIEVPGQDSYVVTRNAQGRLDRVEQGTQSWKYEYDERGRVKARTDAADKRTEYGYDDADRLTSLKKPSGRLYRFGYDRAGNQKTVTMPDGDVHELGHNSQGQLSRFKPAGSGDEQTRTYDKDHALKTMTLQGGRVITSGRDATTGRFTGQGYAEAGVGITYPDATDRIGSMVRDPAGAGTDEGLAYEYDGSMTKAVTASGTAASRYEYGYGAGLLMNNVKLVSGTTTLDTPIVRDDDGLVTTLGPFTFTRTANDTALKIAEGLAFADEMTIDGQQRLATRTVKVNAQQKYRVELTRNVRGQIERKLETVGATATEYLYGYDDDGRLLTVKRDGTVVEEYSYDDNGNRKTRRLGGGAVENLTYDGQERLDSRGGTDYAFDADGFLTTRGADAFVYSARGELLEATVGGTKVTYAYDALGRRVSRTSGNATTQYLYGNPADPFQVTAVRDAAGVLTVYYYDEAGHLIAMRRGTTRFYIATDQVGTPRVVTNGTGTVVKSLSHDTFGNQTADSAAGFELPFGFAGGLTDSVTGLVRFGLRDYDPTAGRWTARDPALFGGGQANLYDYVGSDPVGQRDPSGLICIGGSVYAGFGGGGQICISDEGFSLCAEAGFGVGQDLAIESGLAEDGETIVAEAEFQYGPVKAKVGVELDNSGCISFQAPEAKITDWVAVRANADGDVNLAIEPPVDIENGPEALFGTARAKASAKIAAKFCRRALW